MNEGGIGRGRERRLVVGVAWVAAGAICAFALENIWLEPLVHRRFHHRLPTMVADPLSGTWFAVLLAMAVTFVLAMFCGALVIKDGSAAGWAKALTGAAVLAAAMLGSEWFLETGGRALVQQLRPARKLHAVTLHWDASTTPNVRYNVYRGPSPGFHPDKLNAAPIYGLSFTDTTSQSGRKYYYVARAVDGAQESTDSNETFVDVP